MRVLLATLVLVLTGCSSGPESTTPRRAETRVVDAPPPRVEAPTPLITGGLSEKEFAALHKLSPQQAPAARGIDVELPGGAKAYLSLPQLRPAPMPGVLVIHEWWGLNGHIKHYADRIADEGYAALAVDLYGGQVADTPEKAMELMKAVDEKRSGEILAAAQAFLRDDSRVRAPKIGVIGWCFGGGWSLRTALAEPSPAAAVVFYGQPILERDRLARLQCPILLIYGTRDKSIPAEKAQQMDAMFAELGKQHELLLFDAEHAFANPSGANYAEGPAREAWEAVRRFFATHLH